MTGLELLAPARNADIGIAAIDCGADAVYIGGPAFGAREAAGNDIGEIQRLCRYAKPFGVRIYVTVNTLARDENEMREIVGMMRRMKDSGISAFILQDTSLLPSLMAAGPWKEEFHASTQCSIRSASRAAFLANLGFSRLILERQLSLEQIREIRKAVPPSVQLETFVHGALCVCYSGDCYLSEYLTGRSANRGECAQPCRNLYDLVDGEGRTLVKGKPLLSLKDLKLDSHISELAEAGVTSFKIEGRLKNESYVKNAVRAYSLILDRIVNDNPSNLARASRGHCTGGFTPDLDKTFNRGYTTLFLNGDRGEWGSGDAAKGMGEFIGTVGKIIGIGDALMTFDVTPPAKNAGVEPKINNGDGLCFINGNGEVRGFRTERVENGTRVTCRRVNSLTSGCGVWRNLDSVFERELKRNCPKRSLLVSLTLAFHRSAEGGYGLVAGAACENGKRCTIRFEMHDAVPATDRRRMESMLHSHLEKSCGIYDFRLERIHCDGSLPLLDSSFMNGIRRSAAAALDKPEPLPQNCDIASRQCGQNARDSVNTCNSPSFPQLSELKHPRQRGELMRTKYCIRHRLGLCPKTARKRKENPKELFLRNNGRLLKLHFDCSKCEMVITGESCGR